MSKAYTQFLVASTRSPINTPRHTTLVRSTTTPIPYSTPQVTEKPNEIQQFFDGIVDFIVKAFFVILALCIIFLVYLGIKSIVERKRREQNEQRIDTLQRTLIERGTSAQGILYRNGYEYEQYIARWMKNKGFTSIVVTSKSGDSGVDIFATSPDGLRYAIQCKMYNSGKVGFKAVQEVYTGQHLYGCNRAMIVTTSTLTDAARRQAQKLGVELYERVK